MSVVIKEVKAQEVPSDGWSRPFDSSQPSPQGNVPIPELASRSHRVHKEACLCLFPSRSKNEFFARWTPDCLKAAIHKADVEREMDRLAGRWTKLRRAFNDWLDEIHLRKNNDRLERAKGFDFEAKKIDELDHIDRLLAQLLCHGGSINEREEVPLARNYRNIHWNSLLPKPDGTDQAVA